MILIILFYEILHNRARFEKANGFPIRERICQSWDSAIGIDLEEPGFLLDILLDLDGMGLVWEAEAM